MRGWHNPMNAYHKAGEAKLGTLMQQADRNDPMYSAKPEMDMVSISIRRTVA